MASEIKSDKLSPSTGTSLQIGDASDTITIPTGATFTITDGLGVAGGGTGLTSFTAGDVLYATGTTTLAKLAKGTAEQVLAMNSGATAPDWGSVDLTVLPTITAVKGGTGQTSFTAGDIFYANSTTTITKLGKGSALQGLQTNSGATAPEWANSPQSILTAQGDILYASGANTIARLAKGSGSDTLKMNSGATAPEWVTVAAASADFVLLNTTTVDGTATSVTVDNHYSATYTNYMAQVYISPDDTCDLKLQYTKSGDGTVLTGSSYRQQSFFGQSNGSTNTTGAEKQWGTDHWQLNNGVDTVVSDDHGYNPSYRANWYIWEPLKTSGNGSFHHISMLVGWDGNAAANHFSGFQMGYYATDATTAMTGFKIFTSTGNIEEGSIKLYGIK